MSEITENPEEVQEFEPDEEWGDCVEISFPLDVAEVTERSCKWQRDGCNNKQQWDYIDIVPQIRKVFVEGFILELDHLVSEKVETQEK